MTASTCICPHCGEIATVIDDLGDRIMLYLADWSGEGNDADKRRRSVNGIIDNLHEPLATTYKSVLDLVENGLIESPGKVATSLRGKASYYVLTDKGREAVQQLRRCEG